MRTFLTLLFAIGWAGQAEAQKTGLVTIVVKSGQQLIKLLVEKKADLMIGVVSGTVVTVGDKGMSSILHPDPKPNSTPDFAGGLKTGNCSAIGAAVATCTNQFISIGEKIADVEEMKKALMLVQQNFTLPANSPAAIEPPAKEEDARAAETAFWWSIQSSSLAADFADYLQRYPSGEFKSLAERRLAALTPLPINPTRPTPASCQTSEEAILQPIRGILEAMNRRDVNQYARQWTTNGVFRTYDNRMHYIVSGNLQSWVHSFDYLSYFHIDLMNWRVSLEADGTATVRDSTVTTSRVGSYSLHVEEAFETFRIVCASDGDWAISENVHHLN